ncbi:helicase-related protein [Methylocystis echinoides]|uniref:DNA helicase n=1 Tax=Methylocystis echinoides TaxID=29468 RepID=A0A9W6GXB4_9HYPH|nr:helicase-related protein [Methylocystis echinoides]GLI94668.1 DNA helicase [Methylocystis echinoides]
MTKVVTSARDVRDSIIEALRQELIGPAPGYPLVQLNGEEILRPQDPPRYRYGAGILFPSGVTFSAAVDAKEEARDIEAAEEVGAEGVGGEADDAGVADQPEIETSVVEDKSAETDIEVDPTSTFLPSTMGLSFLADVSGGIVVETSWGTYHKEAVRGYPSYREDGSNPELWFRTPGFAKVQISREELTAGSSILRLPRRTLSPERCQGQLELDVVSRPRENGMHLITVTLVNSAKAERGTNERCFFQCELSVSPGAGTKVAAYPGRPLALQNKEERSLALLYRHRPVFAVGHGCSANWDIHDGVVKLLKTETLPIFEQAPVVPVDEAEGVELSMRRLAEASDRELAASCLALAKAYRKWIEERQSELKADAVLSAPLKERGETHLANCLMCLARIEDGVGLLQHDALALEAFRIMNMAMVEQRAHYALASEDRNRRSWRKGDHGQEPSAPCPRPDYPYETKWRPFQLAFVLMNIRSFVDPSHAERSVVDVIWFPTGGGKTEAYLGLAAFVIMLRRLRDPSDAGTTVLMRYTLRLLTTQQFQRAASLICALEKRRLVEPARFGEVPISIGLWLGNSVTPGKDADAVTKLAKLAYGEGDNPFVVLSCPWCGIDMGPRDYGGDLRVFGYAKEKALGGQRVRFRCEDPGCDFATPAGLPLEVVDEGIYREPPTLLIGTVDKFAMMPWNPESRRLFGIDNSLAKSPPDLVIQDELHLISGPLGSMVGHYETLVDEFCTRTSKGGRIPAKIVASTATIARADEQIRAVYGRRSALFPPQGLIAGESFFAREDRNIPGRTYVGVLATALPSHVTAQVRTLATLLQAPALLQTATGDVDKFIDPYWTLVVYFNSLRELGRASTLVQADIREYLNALWDRIGLRVMMETAGCPDLRRFINNFDELTSRMRSSEIPSVLQKLFAHKPTRDTVDLCYATNMIQVGLDVTRLSLMSIVGQPKGASEYIQASSRVGRGNDKPGLVITNYNPFKPRDRSHFEGFRSFHENAYRHVEATSVTPFSIPVCERAIHALAVTLVRFSYPHLRDSPKTGLTASERQEVEGIIMARVKDVDPDETVRAKETLDSFFDDWDRRKPQEYGNVFGTSHDPLMFPAGRPLPGFLSHLEKDIRSTATSMRNVDADCEATPISRY